VKERNLCGWNDSLARFFGAHPLPFRRRARFRGGLSLSGLCFGGWKALPRRSRRTDPLFTKSIFLACLRHRVTPGCGTSLSLAISALSPKSCGIEAFERREGLYSCSLSNALPPSLPDTTLARKVDSVAVSYTLMVVRPSPI